VCVLVAETFCTVKHTSHSQLIFVAMQLFWCYCWRATVKFNEKIVKKFMWFLKSGITALRVFL